MLKWLQPHQNLKSLAILFYSGSIFPSWIGDPLFSRVVRLTLDYCKKCTLLPALGRLSSLQILVIKSMTEIKSVGNELYGEIAKPFPSLEHLEIQDMPKWKDWLNTKLGVGTKALFPRLRVL